MCVLVGSVGPFDAGLKFTVYEENCRADVAGHRSWIQRSFFRTMSGIFGIFYCLFVFVLVGYL